MPVTNSPSPVKFMIPEMIDPEMIDPALDKFVTMRLWVGPAHNDFESLYFSMHKNEGETESEHESRTLGEFAEWIAGQIRTGLWCWMPEHPDNKEGNCDG